MAVGTTKKPGAILIAGPTASGKSALAVRLAARLGGIVINADSMQVYRDLRILTARPSETERQGVPHALYGTVDGATNHSVSRWLGDVKAVIAGADTLLPIIVGGSGLYFKALVEGLSEIPAVPEDIRAEVRQWALARSPQELYAEVLERDPATAARLRPTDPQRLVRALEVHVATGRGLAAFQAQRAPPILDVSRCACVTLNMPRDALRERVDRRFDGMIKQGALTEVEHLAARRLDPTLPVMRALGVGPLLRHLLDGVSLMDAVTEAKATSRRYLKRQDTFVRTQLRVFQPLAPDQAEMVVAAQFATKPQSYARPNTP